VLEKITGLTLEGGVIWATVVAVIVVIQEAARCYIVQQRHEMLLVKEATDSEEDSLRQLEARVSPLIDYIYLFIYLFITPKGSTCNISQVYNETK